MEMSDKSPRKRSLVPKSILKKIITADQSNNSLTQSISDPKPNIKAKKVCFPDRSKNMPLYTVIEVEPIIYPEVSKKTGCHCIVF
ncbi:unnamed protein product [Blepharisma stoltei]|uniref:Uncharacterized protein n=1 Tax=Blepharisma stoltei TaxID=1481888 RepID=A0AAU9I827_9CILI|nr:unnamed protein product [Blepharisma stoltei]